MSETVTKRSKEEQKQIPKGAKIIRNDVRVEVEEIENGFLITKTEDIKYKVAGSEGHDYAYITTKYYSKTDPLTIQTDDKSLADIFEAD